VWSAARTAGTLFGAGSEGGTVRYITTQPSLTKTSIYSRAEFSSTQGGDPSYEAGVAVGGPLVQDKFGRAALGLVPQGRGAGSTASTL